MKTTKILSLILLVVLATGCKRDNWLDWKMQNEMWLAQNAKKEGVITTPTGLQYKCIDPGPFINSNAPRPDDAKIVTIDYTGQLINSYVFDSADEAIMQVSTVVAGFAEGLKKMSQGSTYEFYIPYKLGYGQEGVGNEGAENFIPPYSTLRFTVYLHSVN